MVRSTLTLLALFNVAILFPGKAMSQNSEGREFNGKYQKEYLDKIAFPIGGIGAGMFCLEGTGAISHVSLRHHPDVMNEPYTFAAIYVKGVENGAKVLEGQVPTWKLFGPAQSGLGRGDKTYGLPRFEEAVFQARFPFATVDLKDKDITEAAIRDYAGMYLVKEKGGLVGKLSPKLGQEKIKVETDSFPHRTPWRVISVADRVGGLLETNILTSLNEPCRIEDTSWIKPCRTTFTWWNGNVVPDSTFSPGNNFDTNKYYIDFAARNGLDAHGIYGYAETPWYYDDNFNFGWAGPNADVTKPIPCLNMPRIVEYARSKGVGIHLWVHWRPLYDKLEEAFALYEGWGVKGLMVDFMDRNDQEMIRIQEEILECAARHRLFIQFHGSSKPSGLVRTYPNEFTREGTLNYEVCKWDTLVNADHDIAIPFTRMLAGATDYHLGGFRALPRSEFKIQYVNPHVMSTRCHMLAMYVVLENHLTSLCDTPKAYEGQPGFEVLRTVPGTWDEIRVPLAKMNEHVTVARRSGSDWWVGSLNNGAERNLKLELDFLSEGDYQATIYTDAEDVDRNPNHLDRQVRKVTRKDIIELNLAKDGGALLHIRRL